MSCDVKERQRRPSHGREPSSSTHLRLIGSDLRLLSSRRCTRRRRTIPSPTLRRSVIVVPSWRLLLLLRGSWGRVGERRAPGVRVGVRVAAAVGGGRGGAVLRGRGCSAIG